MEYDFNSRKKLTPRVTRQKKSISLNYYMVIDITEHKQRLENCIKQQFTCGYIFIIGALEN